MTNNAIREIVKKHGGPDAILEITFDDNCTFFIESKDTFREDMLVTFDGEEFIKVSGYMKNKKTGRFDIPCTVYRTTADIRTVMVIDDLNDKKNIDPHAQYQY